MVSISGARASFGVGAPWLAVACVSFSLACSEDSADTSATGGTSSAGTAGQSTGGQTATAGSGGTAGAPSTGGTSAGGTSSTGGTGSGALPPIRTFNFAANIEDWTFVYAEPPTLIAAAAPAPDDAGATDAADAGAASGDVATAAHDALVGDPNGDVGSVLLNLPFTGPAQKISFEVNVATADTGVNLAGRTLTARIRVDSGWSADPNNPPGFKFYVKTGATSLYADSGYQNVAPGAEWQTFTWANVSNAGYVDIAGTHNPADVRQVGIEFDTGGLGVYSAAVLHLDTVAY